MSGESSIFSPSHHQCFSCSQRLLCWNFLPPHARLAERERSDQTFPRPTHGHHTLVPMSQQGANEPKLVRASPSRGPGFSPKNVDRAQAGAGGLRHIVCSTGIVKQVGSALKVGDARSYPYLGDVPCQNNYCLCASALNMKKSARWLG